MLASDTVSKIPSRKLSIIIASFVVVSYSVFFFQFFDGLRFPDWKSAGQVVMEAYTGGDLIVVHSWRFQKAFSLLYLDNRDVIRYESLGDVRTPKSDEVVLVHDDGGWPTKLGKLTEAYYVNRTWVVDGVYVHKLYRKDKTTAGVFTDYLSRAGIYVIDGGRRLDCRLPENRRVCFAEYWQKVDVVDTDVGGERRRCIFAHPRNNQVLEIVFQDVKVNRSLTVYAGIEDDFVYEDLRYSPCYIDVYVCLLYTSPSPRDS